MITFIQNHQFLVGLLCGVAAVFLVAYVSYRLANFYYDTMAEREDNQ